MTEDATALISRAVHAMQGGTEGEVREATAALDDLFAANHRRVYALCLRLTGNPERARELAQDAVLAAWEQLPGFRGDASFSTWLLRIAKYKCFHALRHREELLSEDGVIEQADPAATVLVRLRRKEKERLLREASVAVLDPQEQEAVYLRYTERLPIARIDALLHLETASGARGLLQRCRQKLGRELRRRLAEMGQGSSFMRGTW